MLFMIEVAEDAAQPFYVVTFLDPNHAPQLVETWRMATKFGDEDDARATVYKLPLGAQRHARVFEEPQEVIDLYEAIDAAGVDGRLKGHTREVFIQELAREKFRRARRS